VQHVCPGWPRFNHHLVNIQFSVLRPLRNLVGGAYWHGSVSNRCICESSAAMPMSSYDDGMADGALMTVEEYLHTSFCPDCDFVDGEVQERLWGEFDHSSTMSETLFYLTTRYPALRKRVLPSLRVRVKATRVRVPDICVLAENAPEEQVVTCPPILCVEILSPEDRMTRFMEKLDDYAEMGVPACWVIDPVARRGWIATPGLLAKATDGNLRSGDLEMPPAEVLR
jgi:Uma2 family endonuclease